MMAAEWKAARRSSSPAFGGNNKRSHHHCHHKYSSASYSSWSRKPPLHSGTDHCSIPLWEKKFVNEVGNKSWKRLLNDQRVMSFMGSSSRIVFKWDDSAALEAFQNAKARFQSKYFGYSSKILIPDPDMFIDEVDFDSSVDPELVDDLEKINLPDDDFIDCTELPVVCTGWVSTEDLIPNNDSTHDTVNLEQPIGEPIDYHVHAWNDGCVASDPSVLLIGRDDAESPLKNCNGDHLIEHQTQLVNATGWHTSSGCNSSGWNDVSLPSDSPVVPTGWGDSEQHVRSNNRDCDNLIERQTQLQDATGWCNASGSNSPGLDASHLPSEFPIAPTGWGDDEQTIQGNVSDRDNAVHCRTWLQDITRCSAASGTNSSGWNVEHGNSFSSNVGGAWTREADQPWSNRRQNYGNSGRRSHWNSWNPEPGENWNGANWNGTVCLKTKHHNGDYGRNYGRYYPT